LTYLLIRHRAADFSSWKVAYDAHADAMAGAGLKEKELLHDINDPSQIVLLFEAADVEKAKEFSESPSLRSAMQGAGVTDKPDIYVLRR
jgi:hypothetical protein